MDPQLAAAIASEALALEASASQSRRSAGRPNPPQVDRLLLALAHLYSAVATAPTSSNWMAFLRCAAPKAGLRVHSDGAFAKRVHTVCKGMGPAALHKQKIAKYRSLYMSKKDTQLGRIIFDLAPHIAHASGWLANIVIASKKFSK